MDKSFVNNYLISNGKYLPEKKLNEVGVEMEQSKISEASVNVTFRNATLFTILYWFMPWFWLLDRFFVRDFIGGLVKCIVYPVSVYVAFLITKSSVNELYKTIVFVAVFVWFVWVIIDGFSIYGRVKKTNYRKLMNALGRNPIRNKVDFLTLLLLVFCIGIVSYGFLSVKNETRPIIESDLVPNETNLKENLIEDEYYEHSCGEEPPIESEYNSLESVNPIETNSPIIEEVNNSPFVNDNVSETETFGKGEGNGIGGIFEKKNRELFEEPNFINSDFFEDCTIRLVVKVDSKGNVIGFESRKYIPKKSVDFLSKRKLKKWEKNKEETLLSVSNDAQNKLRFDIEPKRPTQSFLYEISVRLTPFETTTKCQPIR